MQMTLSEQAVDKLLDRLSALRQHLDGAPVPSTALSWQQEDAWCKQYRRWHAAAQKLVRDEQ